MVRELELVIAGEFVCVVGIFVLTVAVETVPVVFLHDGRFVTQIVPRPLKA